MITSELIPHVLNIVTGHTGISFKMLEERTGDANQTGTATHAWISQPEPITGGYMNMVADAMRIQISFSVDGGHVVMDANSQIRVQVAFIFIRPDGGEFSTSRTILFNGPYFKRFE